MHFSDTSLRPSLVIKHSREFAGPLDDPGSLPILRPGSEWPQVHLQSPSQQRGDQGAPAWEEPLPVFGTPYAHTHSFESHNNFVRWAVLSSHLKNTNAKAQSTHLASPELGCKLHGLSPEAGVLTAVPSASLIKRCCASRMLSKTLLKGELIF